MYVFQDYPKWIKVDNKKILVQNEQEEMSYIKIEEKENEQPITTNNSQGLNKKIDDAGKYNRSGRKSIK